MAGSVYVKLERNQALNLKREILLLEKSLLETIQHARQHSSLRKTEFTLKLKVKKDLEEAEKMLLSIDQDLPKEELIEMNLLEEKPLKKQQNRIQNIQKESKKKDIQAQLQEIQEKLARLG